MTTECPTCKTPVPAGAAFCPNCGTRTPPPQSVGSPTIMINPPLVDPTQTEPAYPPQVPAAYAPPPQQLPPGGYYAPSQPTTSTTAIVSLIGGILAWTVLPLIGMVVALIAGHMARNEIRRAGGQLGGDGLAIAGLILGYAQLVITVIGCCAIIAIGGLTLLGASAGT